MIMYLYILCNTHPTLSIFSSIRICSRRNFFFLQSDFFLLVWPAQTNCLTKIFVPIPPNYFVVTTTTFTQLPFLQYIWKITKILNFLYNVQLSCKMINNKRLMFIYTQLQYAKYCAVFIPVIRSTRKFGAFFQQIGTMGHKCHRDTSR